MVDKLTGGSNPFRKSGTQYAKDLVAIDKLNKKYIQQNKKKKKKKGSNKPESSYKKARILDSVFVPAKRAKPVKDLPHLTIYDSFGESIISDWLRKHDIKFIREKKFADLINPKTNQHLRFDFYLPDNNMCIEFDGKQHFFYCKDFDKGDKTLLLKRQFNDRYKDGYCKFKGLTMLRINYKQIKEITSILSKSLAMFLN